MKIFAIVPTALLGAVLYVAPVAGFDVLGFKTGMTPTEVQVAAPQGYTLIPFFGADPQSYSFNATIVRGTDVFATVAFCHGRLASVIREIDPDIEWPTRLQARLTSSGQPRVSVRAQPWNGPGGGDIVTVVLRWVSGGEAYELSMNPEGRTGSTLRYARSAFEEFAMDATCRP